MKISSVNLESSSYTKNNCGVPQGCMLDPVVFYALSINEGGSVLYTGQGSVLELDVRGFDTS